MEFAVREFRSGPLRPAGSPAEDFYYYPMEETWPFHS